MSKELLTDGMDNAGAFDPHEVVISYEDAKRAIAAALAEKDAVIERLEEMIQFAREAITYVFETTDDQGAAKKLRALLADLDGAR